MKGMSLRRTNKKSYFLAALLCIAVSNVMADPTKKDGIYLINDQSDIEWVCANANNPSNKYRLTNDFNLGNFAGFGTSSAPFKGSFDGNGHAITVDINSSNSVCGLFNYVDGATIKNLMVKGNISVSYKGETVCCGIIGKTNGGLVNVEAVVCDALVKAVSFENNDSYTGGFIGYSEAAVNIKNSLNIGSVNGGAEWGSKPYVGGFVGITTKELSLENCYMAGEVNMISNDWAKSARTLVSVGTFSSKNCYVNASSTINSLKDNSNEVNNQLDANVDVCDKLNLSNTSTVWVKNDGSNPLPFGNLAEEKPYVPTYTNVDKVELSFGEDITNKYDFSESDGLIANTMELSYTFDDNHWHPFYLPLRLPYECWSENFEVAKIMNFHDYTKGTGENERRYVVLEVQRVKKGILKENHPYLLRVKNPSSEAQKMILDGTYSEQCRTLYKPVDGNSISCATTENKYTFIGNYQQKLRVSKGDYIMTDGVLNVDAMYEAKDGDSDELYIHSCEWFMRVTPRGTNSSANGYYAPKRITISIDGFDATASAKEDDALATAIEDCFDACEATPVAYYSKNGVKFNEPQVGLNIVRMSDGSTKKIWVK